MADSLSGLGALVNFVGETKPYHTKLLDIGVGYQYDDNVLVTIGDSLNTSITIDSSWCVDTVSNGINRRFRIPNTYIPRFSNWSHGQYKYTGVTDEFAPGVYLLPFNNAALIRVNGVEYTEGVEFNINYPGGNHLTFEPGFEPLQGDLIEANIVNIDWLYFSFDGVYQNYTLQGYDPVLQKLDLSEYSFIVNSWDVGGWDNFPFDELQDDVSYTTEVLFDPIGKLIQEVDQYGTYSVFEFNDGILPSPGTEISICNQMAWGHHSTMFVKMLEEVKMGSSISGAENMLVELKSANVSDSWDTYPWDSTGWDASRKMFTINEMLNETQTDSTAIVGLTDTANFTITEINQMLDVEWITGDNYSLGNDNLTVIHDGSATVDIASANVSRNSGKYYFELEINNVDPGNSVNAFGIIPISQITSNAQVGSLSQLGAGVVPNGATYIKGSYSLGYFASNIVTGDVIGVMCDIDSNQIAFSLNGVAGPSIAFDYTTDGGEWVPAVNVATDNSESYIITGRFNLSDIGNLPATYLVWADD